MKLKSINIVVFSIVVLLFLTMQAQTSDTNFRMPIVETIHKIQVIFNVKIKDNKGLLKDKVLDYADWKIEPDNLEVSLANVLAPFNLTTFKEADGTYEIREFQHHRVSIPKSEVRLAFLSSLYIVRAT